MKRALVCLLCLLLGTSAMAETYLIQSIDPSGESGAMLVKDDGTIVVDTGTYSEIAQLVGGPDPRFLVR